MNDERIDELRQQLRALGYLDAGVDRFVLGPVREARGPVGLAARAGLRVGLLAGLLLGPGAAVGLAARVPGLVSGARDAVVLATYLAVLFFAAGTALSFVISLLAALAIRGSYQRFAPQVRRSSAIAGWLTTIACLAYLTLWWRNANAGFGWSAPVWTAFALIVAVAISLLLGHAVRIATLGVLAARARADMLPPLPATTWRVLIGGGILAFAGAAALLLATTRSDAQPAAPVLTVADSLAPIRLIALDGFDPATYAKLADGLPALRRMLAGPLLKLVPQDTSDPARAWTTIATGVPPDVHGVRSIETRRVAGLRGAIARDERAVYVIGAATDLIRLTQPSIVSREQRQAKTIWEVAEQAGLRTAVVNWWATWPAPPRGGIVITDRAVLRLEHGGTLDGEIAPASVYQSLGAQWPSIRAHARQAAADAFPDHDRPQIAAILRRSAELDATVMAIAESLPWRSLDLFVVYLPGLDIAQNALIGPGAGTLSASEMAARLDALRSYYPFLDGVLAPLSDVEMTGRTVVVTQPGRVQTSTGGLFAVERLPPDSLRGTATATTVAPTILWALGLPLSREVRTQPDAELFGSVPNAFRWVDSYGRPFTEAAPRTGKPLDQETIDRLRSLGYIK